jgi:hypothetical protein
MEVMRRLFRPRFLWLAILVVFGTLSFFGVSETSYANYLTPTRGPKEKWIQLTVKGAIDAPLVACEARLLTVQRIDADGNTLATILTEPVFCTWSAMPEAENRRMIIPAKISQSANILSILDGSRELRIWTSPVIVGFRDEIQKPGIYRLNIAVTAQDCPTETRSYRLSWGGSYNDIGITPE